MAKGKTLSVTVTLNNKPATTTSKKVELIVDSSGLVPDNRDLFPGVDTNLMH